MMTTLRVILNDHLSADISSLRSCDKEHDVVLMCEVKEEMTYVKHHKKKIVLLLSAMRHFREELEAKGYNVVYIKLDDKENTGSFRGEVQRFLKGNKIGRVVVAQPGEYRLLKDIQTWSDAFDIPVDITPDDRFLCGIEEFSKWAESRKSLRMEYFYRHMRQKHGILMDGDNPVGGKWNYDTDNRKSPHENMHIPKPYTAQCDDITHDVMACVKKNFSDHFGDLEPFHFAVTRKQALAVLNHFIEHSLDNFGDYQDAMIEGEPWVYHSHISFYLNCGLLKPLECIRKAEKAYFDGDVPLNAAEGFIRQIMGWREYIRGVYWLKMPQYANENFFNAKRNLPDFYWSADTKMNCLKQCVTETKKHAYAHHIQRLMVLGNFALLAGIAPSQVNEWFLIVYADAYEWVELPNVSGMILFADGGYLGSKPYAAGGSYIHKMSNYCKNCSYNVRQKNGEGACPFNYLYWDFLARNRSKLESNHRIGMMYKTYDRMGADKQKAITNDARKFLDSIDE